MSQPRRGVRLKINIALARHILDKLFEDFVDEFETPELAAHATFLSALRIHHSDPELASALYAALLGGGPMEEAIVAQGDQIAARFRGLVEEPEGGDKGRVLKATGERWFGGHTVGGPFGDWDPSKSA